MATFTPPTLPRRVRQVEEQMPHDAFQDPACSEVTRPLTMQNGSGDPLERFRFVVLLLLQADNLALLRFNDFDELRDGVCEVVKTSGSRRLEVSGGESVPTERAREGVELLGRNGLCGGSGRDGRRFGRLRFRLCSRALELRVAVSMTWVRGTGSA